MNDEKILAALLAAAMLDGKQTKKNDEPTDFRATAKEIGTQLKEAQLGYMDAGFTEDQAFELMMNAIKN